MRTESLAKAMAFGLLLVFFVAISFISTLYAWLARNQQSKVRPAP
jgi:hypothetical protein